MYKTFKLMCLHVFIRSLQVLGLNILTTDRLHKYIIQLFQGTAAIH